MDFTMDFTQLGGCMGPAFLSTQERATTLGIGLLIGVAGGLLLVHGRRGLRRPFALSLGQRPSPSSTWGQSAGSAAWILAGSLALLIGAGLVTRAAGY